jgi:hypothetical protein
MITPSHKLGVCASAEAQSPAAKPHGAAQVTEGKAETRSLIA